MLFSRRIPFYSEKHTEHINTLSEQNAGILNAEAGGTYNNPNCLNTDLPVGPKSTNVELNFKIHNA
jgi:hypothetical protein